MTYIVHLEAPGNPDFRQFAPIAPSRKVTVTSLDEASTVCLAYMREHELGGGNWCGKAGHVLAKDTNELVAYISYNGCIWTRETDKGGHIFPPTAGGNPNKRGWIARTQYEPLLTRLMVAGLDKPESYLLEFSDIHAAAKRLNAISDAQLRVIERDRILFHNIELDWTVRTEPAKFTLFDDSFIERLVKAGYCRMTDTYNQSPTIRRFVNFHQKHYQQDARVHFCGIAFPPGSDRFLCINGMEIVGESLPVQGKKAAFKKFVGEDRMVVNSNRLSAIWS